MPNIVGNETRPIPPGSGPAPAGLSSLESVLGAAESALGVQYRWGGNSLATGVDCSGLIQQAYRAAGINLPRVSSDQAKAGQAVTMQDAQPGDLFWYDSSGRNVGADHIAIYMGNGMMIESPHSGASVRVVPVRQPTGVTRVLGVVQPSANPHPPTLGPNGGRDYTHSALGIGTPPPPTITPTAAEKMGGGIGDDLPPNATPAQVETYIQKHYSDVAPFLANDEIKKLAEEAAVHDLSPDEVTHRFEQTNYYKTHGDTSRAYDALLGGDRAQADIITGKAMNIVGDLFARNGSTLTDEQKGSVAKQAIRNGWIDTSGNVTDVGKLNDFLAFTLRQGAKPNTPLTGEVGASADTLGSTAKDYGITLSRPTLEDWALKIKEGAASADSYKSYLTNMARGLWNHDPDVLKALDAGLTPTAYFDPQRQKIAATLEMSPDQIDLFGDPTYADVTQHYDPAMNSGKGGRRSMTLGEAAQWARDRPEYEHTTTYKDTKASAGVDLLQFLGQVK